MGFAEDDEPSAQPTPIAFEPWGSGITLRRRGRRDGRTATSNDSSDRYVANLSTHCRDGESGDWVPHPKGTRPSLSNDPLGGRIGSDTDRN